MILKQLLNGRQHSDFIIIKDNLQYNGIFYLKQFIADNLARGNAVQFFSFENKHYSCLESFKTNRFYHSYICFQNPWEWAKESGENTFSLSPSLIKKELQNDVFNIIVIDSLAYTSLTLTIKELCQSLKSIMELNSENCRVQIIGVVHMHMWTEDSIEFKQINRLAKSVIDLRSSDKGNRTVVTHRKHTGKTIQEVYSSSVNSDGSLDFNVVKNEEKENNNPPQIDPMNLTTFKLSLEEKEKEIRSQVILPYLKQQTNKGRIYYEPDDNDDWDDEDPDDDLEI